MLKIVQNSDNLRDFWTIFNIFAKLIFALKFNILMYQHPNNMHKNLHKVFITGQKLTAIAKLKFSNFCRGWGNPLIWSI